MSALIRVVLSAASAVLQPGEKTEVTLTIQNFGEIVDRYKVTVDGVDPAWVGLSRSEISLFPKDQDQVRLTIQPPATAEARAGSYDLRIQVTSQENPAERSTEAFALTIAPQAALELSLHPQKQSGLTSGVYTVRLANRGNTDLNVQFAASDPEEGCHYTFNPPQVALPAGQEGSSQLVVQPKAVPVGQVPKTYAFTVTARAQEAPRLVRQVQGQWEQVVPKKRPIWPFVAAGLGIIVVVVGILVTRALSAGGRPHPTPVAVHPTVARTTATPAPSVTEPPHPTLPSLTATVDLSGTDADGDGLTLAQETALHTDPNNPDTDGDGIPDGTDPNPLVPQPPADTTPPTAEITASPPNPTTNDTVVFTASGTDETALQRIEIVVNGSTVATCYASPCSYSGGPYPAGTVTYGANAFDQAGNRRWTGNRTLTVTTLIPNPITFERFPDGTPIAHTTLLGGEEFSAWGLHISAAPEGSYCSDAVPVIRVDAKGTYLSTGRASDFNACAGVPLRIRLDMPARGVTVRFMGAQVDYRLRVFDSGGNLLGEATQAGEWNVLKEVSYNAGASTISSFTFGYQTALTQVFEISLVRLIWVPIPITPLVPIVPVTPISP
ncbi:MAG: hypothetical protein ACP5SI_05265 [Chloroflexia bacterium]